MYVGYMSYISHTSFFMNRLKSLEFVLNIIFSVFKFFQKIFINI